MRGYGSGSGAFSGNIANVGRRQSHGADSLPEGGVAPEEDDVPVGDTELAQALRIQGRAGYNANMINGTFECVKDLQNGKPVWVSRSAKPAYIFHTGKKRWVISKRVDDGSRCYAYVTDDGGDPSKCKGPWQCSDEKNNWAPDQKITCKGVPGANDPFVKLRLGLEDEMKQVGITDTNSLKQLWRRLDFNGNNVVSLAEIDKMVVELVAGGSWPAWLNNKPALMRAYKKTILVDGDGDDWVEKPEFSALLLNIFWFNKLWGVFDEIDADDDRRVNCQEFVAGMSKLGLKLSPSEAAAEFRKIDKNGGGQVLFVEFCAYIRNRVNPDHDPHFDADIHSGETVNKVVREKGGHGATHGHVVKKKALSDFAEYEKKIKAAMNDNDALRKLWKELDFNGNNIASLAEIDKWVVEKYPLLNHKPALMRAYKASCGSITADDWVQKKEFKTLLGNLFYFNKIYWLFDQVDEDHDRRLNLKEFKFMLSTVGLTMSEAKAEIEFQKLDTNKGGIVLFDEFCAYVTNKQCPEAMTHYIE
eukprot:TRINITY_DN13547_c0_g1_i1.p1 TRINITY_DN13547_c0_g1~~TRINITY_DN13547_c0_g1_i1.p1  ORF type:complete len:530 (-),score=134.71 TRINITY_DN13547_c0_g1_i1:237-1826(-)